eukprot:5280775-Pyramimonas_sp.AAC.1
MFDNLWGARNNCVHPFVATSQAQANSPLTHPQLAGTRNFFITTGVISVALVHVFVRGMYEVQGSSRASSEHRTLAAVVELNAATRWL